MTDAQNGGKMTKFAFESYWKKSQQFFASPVNHGDRYLIHKYEV